MRFVTADSQPCTQSESGSFNGVYQGHCKGYFKGSFKGVYKGYDRGYYKRSILGASISTYTIL